MIPMPLAEVAALAGGRLARPEDAPVAVTGPASLDSRTVAPGGLFVAVVGARVDGHAFAEAAARSGAAAALGTSPTVLPTVLVDDVVAGLGALARHLVARLPDTEVLALTGSQGKTGTKDYLDAILSTVAPTVATAGNYNNELGVPLTVLRAEPATRYLVVEMGARGEGHLRYLCELAPPRIAAVLNVGTAHLGEFGSREAIARAKGELVAALPADGVAVLNSDDPWTLAMAERTAARVLTFGESGAVSWRRVHLDELGRPGFDLVHQDRAVPVTLPLVGRHQVANATAAAAMAVAAGVALDIIAAGLAAAVGSPWRMEPHRRDDGLLVINDAYNANPASMTAALDTLAAIGAATGRRTIAVLGEMRELGDESVAAHHQVGATAAELDVDVVVGVGAAADDIVAGARSLPQWSGRALPTAGRAEALSWLRHNIAAEDVVLVKASRGAALEHLVAGVLDQAGGEETGA